MSASLVGSEMCIRDSFISWHSFMLAVSDLACMALDSGSDATTWLSAPSSCLLYTSDAADDM
eukprot:754497-Alexandrium_andersonii.AAC.1